MHKSIFPMKRDWTVCRRDCQCGSLLGQNILLEFTISANGFLRYMVRSIAGTVLAVGRGEIDEGTVARALDERRRDLAGPTAPAHGLTLKSVQYV